jgi:hypothetical protein
MKNQNNQTNKNYKFRKPNNSQSRPSRFSNNTDTEHYVNVGDNAYKNAVKARDKYLLLAREAYSSGDRIAAESFYQHADHYERTIIAAKGVKQEEEVSE